MSENFGINDDRRRLYGDELCVESNKYNHAILRLIDDGGLDDDVFSCIINKVLDLDNPIVSDEGITKGELHKRDRLRFASGVFEAFFDEKIIDEKQYDKLFRNLREKILEDYLGPNREKKKQMEEYCEQRKKDFEELLGRGVKLRSGRVLPTNDQKTD